MISRVVQKTSSETPFGHKRIVFPSKCKTIASEADSIYTEQTLEVAVEPNTFSENKNKHI